MDLIHEQFDEDVYFEFILDDKSIEGIKEGGLLCLEESIDGINYHFSVLRKED